MHFVIYKMRMLLQCTCMYMYMRGHAEIQDFKIIMQMAARSKSMQKHCEPSYFSKHGCVYVGTLFPNGLFCVYHMVHVSGKWVVFHVRQSHSFPPSPPPLCPSLPSHPRSTEWWGANGNMNCDVPTSYH